MTGHGHHDDQGLLVLVAGFVIAVAVGGASVLDHAPWLLAWLLAGVFVGLAVWLMAGGRVRPRVPLIIAGIAVLVAAVTWIGGFGPALNRDTQRQIRARPIPAAVVHRVQHPHHARHAPRHRPASQHHSRRRASTQPHPPAAAVRALRTAGFYGVSELSRWRWARLVWPAAIVLGLPVLLIALAAVLAVGVASTRLRRGPGRSQTGGPLRVAGRGR